MNGITIQLLLDSIHPFNKSASILFKKSIRTLSSLPPTIEDWNQEFKNDPEFNNLIQNKDKSNVEFITSISEYCSKPETIYSFKMLNPVITPSKHIIYSFLLDRLQLLNSDYQFGSGNNSVLMVGPKGIGKTVSLRSFTFTMPLVYPNICFIFIEYTDNVIPKPSEVLLKEYHRRFPNEKLRDHQKENDTYTISEILYLYLAKGLKLFIIFDELDQVYTMENEHNRTIIRELSALSSNSIGINYVVAC